MPVGWTFAGEPPSLGSPGGTVTLVEGAGFCVCGRTGDIAPDEPHGLFFRDTRLLSRWQLLVDDQPPEPLATMEAEPFATTFVARAQPRAGRADSTLLVLRHRYVGDGMREDIVLRNLAGEPAACTVSVAVGADFADLFEVKESRVQRRGEHALQAGADGLLFQRQWRDDVRGSRVHGDGWTARMDGTLTIDVVVPARGEWSGCLQVHPSIDGVETPTRYACGEPVERTVPSQRLRDWRLANPVVHSAHAGLISLLQRTEEDLGALRIFDPEHPDRVAVAAGAPVVHDGVRPRLAADGVDGAAARSEPRAGHAPDAGPVPGDRGGTPQRPGARARSCTRCGPAWTPRGPSAAAASTTAASTRRPCS